MEKLVIRLTNEKDLELRFGKQVRCMLASGKMIDNMAGEDSSMKMESTMRVTSLMIKLMEKGNITIMMVLFIKVTLVITDLMVRE